MRPRYLDRHDTPVLAFLLACAIAGLLALCGCEIPLPPTPTPDPGPPPVVVPVTQGQRFALIVQESREQTAEMSRMIVDLQAGESSAYFAKHGHSVVVLDVNAKDENGRTLSVIERLTASIENKPLPVLVVASKTKEGRVGNVLFCESFTGEPLARDVVAAVKTHGGGE